MVPNSVERYISRDGVSPRHEESAKPSPFPVPIRRTNRNVWRASLTENNDWKTRNRARCDSSASFAPNATN